MSSALEVDRAEVEKKVKFLLTQFRREIKKMKEECYTTKWFAFNSLTFLLNIPKSNTKPQECGEALSANSNFEGVRGVGTSHDAEDNMHRHDLCTLSPRPVHSPWETDWHTNARATTTLMPLQNDSKRKQNSTAEETTQAIRQIPMLYEERDEYQIFGEYIACKIRKLHTHYAKSTVQHLIYNILYQADLGQYDYPPKHLTKGHHSCSPSPVASADASGLPQSDDNDSISIHDVKCPDLL